MIRDLNEDEKKAISYSIQLLKIIKLLLEKGYIDSHLRDSNVKKKFEIDNKYFEDNFYFYDSIGKQLSEIFDGYIVEKQEIYVVEQEDDIEGDENGNSLVEFEGEYIIVGEPLLNSILYVEKFNLDKVRDILEYTIFHEPMDMGICLVIKNKFTTNFNEIYDEHKIKELNYIIQDYISELENQHVRNGYIYTEPDFSDIAYSNGKLCFCIGVYNDLEIVLRAYYEIMSYMEESYEKAINRNR